MAISLKSVEKSVGGVPHIYETSLDLDPGSFNILLGTTLSGKTSLMRLMAGLDKPTSGEIWFEGKNVTGVAVRKRNLAMVYQAFINYPNFSVFENIASPLRVARVPDAEVRQRVGDMADLLKLNDVLDRDVSQLSGGQQQRTAIARALVKRAALVLLDEPLANLDYKLREELRDEMPRLFADSGSTVVYATSEPEEALMLAGFTAALHEGRVVQFGPTIHVYRKPNTFLTASVFSDPPVNRVEIEKDRDVIKLSGLAQWSAPTSLQNKPDGRYLLGVRPHHVTLAQSDAASAAIKGTVQIAEISGSQSLIHFEAGGTNWISETRGVHPFSVNQRIEVNLQLENCMYFDCDSGRRLV
ncbi:MAG: ABC transporter ATP-binding protein [Pseudomonadota bacterium]